MRVALAIPATDLCATPFAHDLMKMVSYTMLTAEGLEIVPIIVQGSLTTMQRQTLAKDVIECGADWCLWLDTDMRFPKETLHRLLSHGQPFVAANYSTRRMPPRPTAVKAMGDDGQMIHCYTTPDSTGLESVYAVGLGCALVEVSAMKRLADPLFQTPWSTSSSAFIGEDVFFCRKLADAGVDILVDHDLSKHVDHVGTFVYRHDHTLIESEAKDADL